MSVTKVRGRSKAIILLAGLFLTATGMAVAQQRTSYFRFMSSFSANQPGEETLPVPLPPSSVENKIDFGNPGGITELRLRALVGEPVSMEFGTIGGVAPIAWLPGPPMPPGLRYEEGIVWGVPTAPAKGVEFISAKDSTEAVARGRIDFDIVHPEVVVSSRKPIIRMGTSYDGIIASNVATPSYTVRGLPGAIVGPADSNARANLSGSPQGVGTFPFSVEVRRPGTQIFGSTTGQVVVANLPAISFNPASIPALSGPVEVTATAVNVIGTATLSPVGDTRALQLRGLRYESGKLKGVLGTGPATSLTLKLVDSADQSSVTATFPIPAIAAGESAIVIGPLRPGDPSSGVIRTDIPDPVCTVLQAVPGITVSSNCVISGGASQPGEYVLSVSIVPGGNPGAQPVVVTSPVTVNPTLVAGPSQPSFSGYPGGSVNLTVNTSGIVGTPSFELVGITVEQLAAAGLVFDPVTGAITGTLNPGVNITIEVKVTDSEDGKSTSARFIVVSAPANISTDARAVNLRSGDVRTFSATTNIVNAVFTLLDAPDSVRIDERTGIITYQAPEVTEETQMPGFAIRVANAERPNVFKQATVTTLGVVRPKLGLVIAESTEGRGNVNLEIPFQIIGVSGSAEVKLTSGSLPSGMTVRTAAISGKPTSTPATYRPVLRLTDSSDGRMVDVATSIVIGPSLDIAFSGPALPIGKGTVGQPFSVTATAQNAIGTVTFENVATASSPGLLTSAGLGMTAQGVISGTPTTPMTAAVNIRMTEVIGGVSNVVDRELSLAVGAVQNAASAYPVVTLGGVDVTAEVYDNSSTTMAPAPVGGRLLYTFSEPVTVNGITLSGSSGAAYPYSVRNVTTGQVFNISTNSAGQFSFAQTTSDKWEVYYGSGAVWYTTARLTFGGVSQVAPSFTPPALTASSYAIKGIAISPIGPGSILNATAPQSWTTSGSVPPGLSVNSATGVISGTPTETGTFDFGVALTDARGIRSVVAPLKLSVMTGDLAAFEFPTISGAPGDAEDALAALYDNASDTAVTFATGQTLTYTFSKPVLASHLFLPYKAGNWWITAVDENRTFYEDPSSGYNAFAIAAGPLAGVSKVWQVRYIQGGSVQGAVVAGGAILPMTPYLAYGSSIVSATKGAVLNIAPTSKTTGSLKGVPLVGTYRVIEGTLPENLSIDPDTGVISGSPTKVEEKTVKIAFVTTIPGVRSFARSMKIMVIPAENADTIIPAVSAIGMIDPDKGSSPIAAADVTGYVYRHPAYGTYFNVPAGQKITYTFPTETTVNSFSVQRAGLYTVVNEDTGVTVFNGSANAGATSIPQSYGKVFSIRGGGAYTNGWLKLGNGNASAPSAYFTTNTASIRSLALTANQAISESISVTAVGAVSATLSGGPGTVTYDTVNRRIVGSVSDYGDYQVDLRIEDSRGLSSAPIRLNLSVLPSSNAATEIPVISGSLTDPDRGNQQIASQDLVGYLYDTHPTSSRFGLASGQKITMTFDKPVAVSSLHASGAFTFSIVNDDTGAQVHTGSVGSGGGYIPFNASAGRSFTITSSSSTSLGYLRLGHGATAASVPYFSTGNASVNVFAGAAVNADLGLVNATAPITFTQSGLPGGLSISQTGRITGSLEDVGAFTATIRATDSRGHSTAPITATVTVFSTQTARNSIAVASAYGGMDSADVSARLMDNSLDTSISIAPGESIIFSYPGPTLASGFYMGVNGSNRTVEITDDSGAVRYTGTTGTGYFVWSSDTGITAPNGRRAVISSSYKVKNTSSQSLSFNYLIPQYDGALDAAVVYPHVVANPSYTGIPRTGAHSIAPSASLAVGNVTWTVSGSLPTGFNLNPATGAISRTAQDATASASETRNVTLSLTDSRGLAAMRFPITLQVN